MFSGVHLTMLARRQGLFCYVANIWAASDFLPRLAVDPGEGKGFVAT